MNNSEIQIGKYTLESLTTGMYSDPKIVYREYIQNSVDSLESAVADGLIEPQSMRIDIVIDVEEASITIRDNGSGIPNAIAPNILMNVGNSSKRHSTNRGFRGIGRLGGMSYCDELKFTTSCDNEAMKTTVTFDCKRLRELLVPGQYDDMDMAAVLSEVTTIERSVEKCDKHYFIVKMCNVSSFSDLLNIDIVSNYISQVAPVPYRTKKFVRVNDIHNYLSENGYVVEEFPIFIGKSFDDLEPVFKPNRHRFISNRNQKNEDEIIDVRFFNVIINDEVYALGWYGICNWYGTIFDSELQGLRVRKGNILIGDNKTMNSIFSEPRFNGWVQGEIFIITDKLIPNARRDDFEQNQPYYDLISQLQSSIGLEIGKSIREASKTRNDPFVKIENDVIQKVDDAKNVLDEGFNSKVDKTETIDQLKKAQEAIKKSKPKDDYQRERKNELEKQIDSALTEVTGSNNYKVNQINSGIDKKSRKMLNAITEILSIKLSKKLVDEIIDEIIKVLNKR
jgi:molecular chaperone HtpG